MFEKWCLGTYGKCTCTMTFNANSLDSGGCIGRTTEKWQRGQILWDISCSESSKNAEMFQFQFVLRHFSGLARFNGLKICDEHLMATQSLSCLGHEKSSSHLFSKLCCCRSATPFVCLDQSQVIPDDAQRKHHCARGLAWVSSCYFWDTETPRHAFEAVEKTTHTKGVNSGLEGQDRGVESGDVFWGSSWLAWWHTGSPDKHTCLLYPRYRQVVMCVR